VIVSAMQVAKAVTSGMSVTPPATRS
jgi:hypothetical protein